MGVTLLFATYTLLVIPAVLVFGPLSNVKGSHELLIGAIVVAAVAAGLFAAAQALVVLFVAQAVQALALGALQGTAPRRWWNTTQRAAAARVGRRRWRPRRPTVPAEIRRCFLVVGT